MTTPPIKPIWKSNPYENEVLEAQKKPYQFKEPLWKWIKGKLIKIVKN
jgi:hypothetical protein